MILVGLLPMAGWFTLAMFEAGRIYLTAVQDRQASIARETRLFPRSPSLAPRFLSGILDGADVEKAQKDVDQFVKERGYNTIDELIGSLLPRPRLRDAISAALDGRAFAVSTPYAQFWDSAILPAQRVYMPRQVPATVALCFLWAWFYPFVVLAALAVFRTTLRRASIAWPHLLRIVAYSYSVVALMPLVWLVSVSALPMILDYERIRLNGWERILGIIDPMFWTIVMMLVWLAIRLAGSMRRYANIPGAAAMAWLSQVIVWLIVLPIVAYSLS